MGSVNMCANVTSECTAACRWLPGLQLQLPVFDVPERGWPFELAGGSSKGGHDSGSGYYQRSFWARLLECTCLFVSWSLIKISILWNSIIQHFLHMTLLSAHQVEVVSKLISIRFSSIRTATHLHRCQSTSSCVVAEPFPPIQYRLDWL